MHRDNYSVGSSRSWMPAFAVNWQSTEGNSSQHQRRRRRQRRRRQQQHLCADDACTCIIAIFIFAPCAVCARTLPSNYKFLNCSTAHICTFNSKLLCSSTLPAMSECWTTAHISLHKLEKTKKEQKKRHIEWVDWAIGKRKQIQHQFAMRCV